MGLGHASATIDSPRLIGEPLLALADPIVADTGVDKMEARRGGSVRRAGLDEQVGRSPIMRTFLQVISIFAIALRMGLVIGGNVYLGDSSRDVGQQMRAITMNDRDDGRRSFGAALFGTGASFLTLGTLGLVVPWGNALIHGRRSVVDGGKSIKEKSDSSLE
jgi:hypothetical protein